MNLHSSASLDGWPLLLELIHHLFPHKEALIGELLHTILCLLLEEVEPESSLDCGGFLHQESQVLVGFSCLVHPEVLLEHSRSKDRALGPFEHAFWYLYKLAHFIFVGDAVEHRLLLWLVQILSSQLNQLPAVNISQLDVEVSEELLKVHQDEGDWPPLLDVCSPERDELRCLINKLSLPEHELMQGVLVHEFVVASGLGSGVLERLYIVETIVVLCILLCSLILGCGQSHLHLGLSSVIALELEVGDAVLGLALVDRDQGHRHRLPAVFYSPNWWLQVKLDGVLVELLCMDFIPGEHLGLVMELHASELDRWSSFLKGWSQVNVLRDDTSVEKADHALVDILLRDWRRVLKVFLLLKILLVPEVSGLPCSHHATQGLLCLVWSILVGVGCSRLQDACTFRFEQVVRSKQASDVLWLCLEGEQGLFLGGVLDSREPKVRQVLVRLAEVLRHRVDEHLVLPLEAGERLLQLELQVLQMLRYLAYTNDEHNEEKTANN